jgi:hypothetical protein
MHAHTYAHTHGQTDHYIGHPPYGGALIMIVMKMIKIHVMIMTIITNTQPISKHLKCLRLFGLDLKSRK